MSEHDRQPQPGQIPVLDTKVGWSSLHADGQQISYGRRSMPLDEIEWVGYWVEQVTEKRFMFPTTYTTYWHFEVGKYPHKAAPAVTVSDSRMGRQDELPDWWTFLVNLSAQVVEPRLLADLVNRVRQGETVTIGGSIKVNQQGISCKRPKLSLDWNSIYPPESEAGFIYIYATNSDQAVLAVPLGHPNAVLIQPLFAALS
ncbi:hypothetical protein ABZS29_21255 [Kribbella sp. NPDC005582]|uniref:hypothetical protein n=1 Tax=Kribbella sp. NPDC005582 TaxID=3156893 RepID=UPI0033B8CF3D